MCATRAGTVSPSASTVSTAVSPPKVRWSTNRSSGPSSSNRTRTRRWVSSGRSAGWTSSWPLIPRWASTAPSASPSGPVRSNQRNLPRRRAAARVRPTRRSASSAAPPGWRRTARGCRTSTAATVRPTAWSATPRRTTPTSGSSGSSAAVGLGVGSVGSVVVVGRVAGRERLVGGLRSLLLGVLLGAPDPDAEVATGHHRRRRELLGVVRALVGDPVLRHAPTGGRGQLLEAGLPVQARTEARGGVHQVAEEAQDERAGHVDAMLQVHRPEDGLD